MIGPAAAPVAAIAALILPLALCASDVTDESYHTLMVVAGECLESGDMARAEAHYRRAAEAVPESEEAWLGLQLTLIRQERWVEASEAGARVLSLAPKNYYGISRAAFSRYMLGDYIEAERLYRLALEMDPEGGEMLLGLGFTRMRLGDPEEATLLCRRAGVSLPDDSRVEECLALSHRRAVEFAASVLGTYLHYTDPWEAKSLKSLSLSLGLEWPVGFDLWVGTNLSEVVLRYEIDDFWQVNPVLGLGFARNGFATEGSFSWLFSGDDAVDGTPVALAGIGYDGRIVGGGIGLAGSFYPQTSVAQLDPRLRFHVGEVLHIGLGPELIIVGGQGAQSQPSQGPSSPKSGPELHWSGELDVRWIPLPFMSVFAWGYGGPRTLAVEAKGMSVWTSGDLYLGGYSLGMGFDIGVHFAITAAFRHDIGAEQGGEEHVFHRLGGTIGLHVRL